MNYTVNLGSNIIEDCNAVLVVEDLEVFRFRERSGDGQLVVDFDIRNEKGEKLAVIAKNNVVFAAEGFRMRNLPTESFVEDAAGKIYARVKEVSSGLLSVEGEFCVNGFSVSITPEKLVAGGLTMKGNSIRGFGKAINLKKGSFAIGSR